MNYILMIIPDRLILFSDIFRLLLHLFKIVHFRKHKYNLGHLMQEMIAIIQMKL